MSTMSTTGRRISLEFRRKPMAGRRMRVILLVSQRADGGDCDCARKVVRSDVAGKLKRLDRGVAHRLVDALEEWRHAGLILHCGRVRIGDSALDTWPSSRGRKAGLRGRSRRLACLMIVWPWHGSLAARWHGAFWVGHNTGLTMERRMLECSWNESLVQGYSGVRRLQRHLCNVHQLLGILPDLTSVCAKREPETDEIRLYALPLVSRFQSI